MPIILHNTTTLHLESYWFPTAAVRSHRLTSELWAALRCDVPLWDIARISEAVVYPFAITFLKKKKKRYMHINWLLKGFDLRQHIDGVEILLEYQPDMGTRSRTLSAFLMRYNESATTCWHQNISLVSQVHVTEVILHLTMKNTKIWDVKSILRTTVDSSSTLNLSTGWQSVNPYHKYFSFDTHLSKLIDTLNFLSGSAENPAAGTPLDFGVETTPLRWKPKIGLKKFPFINLKHFMQQ